MSSAPLKGDYDEPTRQQPGSLSMSHIVAVEDASLSRQRLQKLTHTQPAACRHQRTSPVAGALQTSIWLIVLAASFMLHVFVIRRPRCSKGASHPSSTDSTGGAGGTNQTQLQESRAATSPRTRSDDSQEKAQRGSSARVLVVSILLLTASFVLQWYAKQSAGDQNFVPTKHPNKPPPPKKPLEGAAGGCRQRDLALSSSGDYDSSTNARKVPYEGLLAKAAFEGVPPKAVPKGFPAASISLTDLNRRIPSETATVEVLGHKTIPQQLKWAATAAVFAASMLATWFLKTWIENGVPMAPWRGAFEGSDNGNPQGGDPDAASGFPQPVSLELQGGPPSSETSPTDGSATESAQGLPSEEGDEQREDTLERRSSDLEDEEPIFPAWFEEHGTPEDQPSVVQLEGDEGGGPDLETPGAERHTEGQPSVVQREGDVSVSQGEHGRYHFLSTTGALALTRRLLSAGSSAVAGRETGQEIQSHLENVAQQFIKRYQNNFLEIDISFVRGDTVLETTGSTEWWKTLRPHPRVRTLHIEHPVVNGVLVVTLRY